MSKWILCALFFVISCGGGESGTPSLVLTVPLNQNIAAGDGYTLFLKSDGTVWAWGDNSTGQLGDGTTTNRTTPVQVHGLTKVTAIAAGINIGLASGAGHAMALRSDGTVWAWGANLFGQLGNGSTTNHSEPVLVGGLVNTLTDVIAIAAGDLHSIALKSDGTVWTWGFNQYGQLGDGTHTNRSIPVMVKGLGDIAAITGGVFFSVALKRDGTVWAWGGGLEDLTAVDPTIPRQVEGLTNITKIASNMALKRDGTVWILKKTPEQVTGLTDVVTIARGVEHAVALKKDGTVWAWGNNTWGQLGDGSTADKTTPVQVNELTDVVDLAAGSYHSVVLRSDGTMWVWGLITSGPIQVAGLNDVISIATKNRHNIALKTDGTVWTLGFNFYGQLGDGTITGRITPVQVLGITDIMAVATGEQHSVALNRDGTVWTWGHNAYGQLGDGTTTDRNVPVQVTRISDVIEIAAGGFGTLALKSDGTVWTWGDNRLGQFGNGTKTDDFTRTTELVQVNGLTNVVAIATSGFHALALKQDGTVWTWGWNKFGQLGDGTSTDRTIAVQVSGLTDTIAIAAGGFHSLALNRDGTVWAWGDNSSGQLGNGTTTALFTPTSTPVQVKELTEGTAIGAGLGHSIALKKDGTVWAWGHNLWGQLGDGTKINRSTAVKTNGISDVTAISGGYGHTIVLKRDGTIWQWGLSASSPVQVSGFTP